MASKNRIKRIAKVKGRDLIPNPRNWRIHPQSQRRLLRGVVEEVGIADVLLARETDAGLMLIDGHCRAEEMPDQEWSVAVLDIDESEESLLLASLDPISAMAETDDKMLKTLLDNIDSENEQIAEWVNEQNPEPGQNAVCADFSQNPPPKMAWVLIGCPIVDYVEIDETIRQLAENPKLIVEIGINDDVEAD